MAYQVKVTAPAAAELGEAFEWISRDSPGRAADWLGRMETAIGSLADHPHRCPLTPESREFPEEIRQLIHLPYRILFVVRGPEVLVLHVRHGARDRLGSDNDNVLETP